MNHTKLPIILFLFVMALASPALASRVAEIEEYYSSKASNILKTRFPDKPFIVFVKVDTGDEKARRRTPVENRRRGESTQLPYLEIEEDEPEIWTRNDIPITTLIGYLKKVELKVQIDSSLSEVEMKELQQNLVTQLQLVPEADSIEITRMEWTSSERWERVKLYSLFALLGLGLFSGIMWGFSKISVNALVRGLSKPIAEIGKSTQQFANNALNMVADKQYGSEKSDTNKADDENSAMDLGSNLLELRKSALELLTRNREVLAHPDAEVLSFIERRGQQNPAQMGAILAELDEKELRTLFKYGRGDWWFLALAQPQPIAPVALTYLNELDRLRLRRHFAKGDQQNMDERFRNAGLVFGRMQPEQLTQIMTGTNIEKAEPILDLLPRDLALNVAKHLFPGQWATLLDSNRRPKPLDVKLLETLEHKAIELFPLRKEEQIKAFFAELDIVRYLDIASPRDEKDFYLVLPEDSRIRMDRFPFYQIFEAEKEVLKLMGPELSPMEWALAFYECESSEVNQITSGFSERLVFLVKEELKKNKDKQIDTVKVRQARRKAVLSYLKNVDIFTSQQVNATNDTNVDTTPKAA